MAESELVKLALNPEVMAAMTRSIKGLGAGAGMGAAAGGLIGGALGAARGFSARRAEGGSVSESVGGGLKGIWPGAKKGLVAGAVAGGAAGALRPAYAEALSAHLPKSSRFGQRQVHAFSGVGDPDYVRSIGGGAHDALGRLHTAQGAQQAAAAARNPELYRAANQELTGARRGYMAANKAEHMGLTSLPGYARALYQDPVGALKAGIGEQWHSGGGGSKALLFGLPAAAAAGEVMHGGKDEEGHERFERTGRGIGDAAGFLAGPLPIAGQMALAPALRGAFGGGGKFLDRSLARLKQRRQPSQVSAAPAPEPAGGDTQSEGYVWSDRAAGAPPEGMST